MDRRESLKLIATGAVAVPAVIAACNTEEKKTTEQKAEPSFNLDRYPEELKREKKLLAEENFFTPEEMATITILADIIIPKDEVSGSASDAKVPDFIEFIVKDMPEHQVPLRGGLSWLDVECLKRYEKPFRECSHEQQIEMVDDIAYPERKLKPGMSQGVKFFNKMRDLVATGFYTSEIGVKDLGYMGNRPNQWNGVPDDVLKQYGMAYTEKELKECVKFD
ncbi:MAG: gluconate 2-dehydrogenase subunit 3 family protein [Chitinophagales bacterium]|nr:gluconate 2-dehydrogenase subunit 3 family protein [Chitinophagales bacterium]